MTQENAALKVTPKQKRARHANAQANYMQRKREEGKEWLATWVPGPAKASLKALAAKANEDREKPSKSYIETIESLVGDTAPDWAKESLTLLNIWLISEHNPEFTLSSQGNDAPKKDKKKKKKKKDK